MEITYILYAFVHFIFCILISLFQCLQFVCCPCGNIQKPQTQSFSRHFCCYLKDESRGQVEMFQKEGHDSQYIKDHESEWWMLNLKVTKIQNYWKSNMYIIYFNVSFFVISSIPFIKSIRNSQAFTCKYRNTVQNSSLNLFHKNISFNTSGCSCPFHFNWNIS